MMSIKCKCLTCNHITEMEKLIPDKTLRNKVLAVTDDLYNAMASECIDKDMDMIHLKAENDRLKKTLSEISNGVSSLEGIKE